MITDRMLERTDVASIEYRVKFPENFTVNFSPDALKNVAIGDLKSRVFSHSQFNYVEFAELLHAIPFLALRNENSRGNFLLSKDGIRVEVALRKEVSITIGEDQDDKQKEVTDEGLREISNDSNLLTGILLGKLGLKKEDMKASFECNFEKDHIFEKGFSEHFNQSFLAKLRINEVPEIDVKTDDTFAEIPSSIRYDLIKGEKKDKLNVNATFKTFSSIAFDSFLNEAIKKTNEILGILGAK